MPSTSTSMSAQRCFTAWKQPIGRPNCTRSFAYSTAMSSTALRATEHLGRGRRRRRGRATLGHRATSPSVTRRRARRARSQPSGRVRSIAASRAGRPTACMSTANNSAVPRPRPSRRRARRRRPARTARGRCDRRAASRRRFAARDRAGAPRPRRRNRSTRPRAAAPATPCRRRARTRRRRAPWRDTGAGAACPPSASSSTASSTSPRPRPPCDSGTATPSQPCSTIDDQSAGVVRRVARRVGAHDPGRRPVVEQIARRVTQRELVVGQLEVHVHLPPGFEESTQRGRGPVRRGKTTCDRHVTGARAPERATPDSVASG